MAQDYTLLPGQQVRIRFNPFTLRMLAQLDQSLPPHNVYFVDSTNSVASTANSGAMDAPLPTWTSAYGKCTTAKGDRIIIMPGHTETFTGAAALTLSKSDVVTIGLGEGQNRPRFTFGTSTGASVVVTGANNWLLNVIGIAGIDGLTNPFHIQAADFVFDLEWQDGSSTVEAARAILTTAAADRLRGFLRYRGFTAGDACVNAIRLVGCDGGQIDVDCYGKASTAWIEFLTTACTNIRVTGTMYNSGTTDGSKDIVDTVTGSTWSGEVFDASAGSRFKGGSGAAWNTDPAVSAVTDALYGATGIASYPAAADPGNGVSIAEVLRSIWDAQQGANGIATYPAGAAYANNVSMAEVLAYIQDAVRRTTGTILPAATSLYDILSGTNGIPSAWPTAAAPAAAVSLAGAIRELFNQMDKAAATAAAAIAATTTVPLFTIAGGPIEVLGLYGIIATNFQAAATTLQFNATTTTPAGATALSIASASLSGAAAGTSVMCTGTFGGAPTVTTAGAVAAGTTKFMVPIGTIDYIAAGATNTGTIAWYLRYRPLARGVTVTPAF